MGKGWIFNILFLILMPRRIVTSPILKMQEPNNGAASTRKIVTSGNQCATNDKIQQDFVGPAGRDYVKEGHEERKRRKNDGLNKEVADDMKKEPSSRRTPVARKTPMQLLQEDSDFSDEEDRARRRKSRGFKGSVSFALKKVFTCGAIILAPLQCTACCLCLCCGTVTNCIVDGIDEKKKKHKCP